MLTPEQTETIRHYLQTGDVDHSQCPWPGGIVLGGKSQRIALREALVEEVKVRAAGKQPPVMPDLDLVAYTRKKVKPMVTGLFPANERESVLQILEKSVVFLTPASIESVLTSIAYESTAWDLANLYLLSLDAELLSDRAERIVGLSSETTCFVSLEYFHHDDHFADFIVHEAAHVFHNTKGSSRNNCRIAYGYATGGLFSWHCFCFNITVSDSVA